MIKRTLLIAAAALTLAAPAHAASVAYIDGSNLWLSSPDGSNKVQLTQDGSADYPYGVPSQGPDGKTVVYHRDTFQVDGHEEHRPVLYLFGADGKIQAANVMPVYSGATAPVYPIGLDMDWDSKTVAFGYQYCGFACKTLYRGVWLTFSDQQPMNPSNPQGQSDSFFPTFYKHRIVSSDSGGRIFVQPDVPEAPFTSSYTGWLDETPDFRLSRAEVSMTGDFVALDWTQYDPADPTNAIGNGIAIGRHQGTVPSNVTQICNVPTAANPGSLTFSYDGTQMAWKDDEGVKVAGVPNLAAGTATCQLTAPPVVISSTGRMPHFGGADVGATLAARNPAGPAAGGGDEQTPGANDQGGQTPPPPPPAQQKLSVKLTGKSLAKGIVITVGGVKPGKVAASASVAASVARKAGLTGKARRSLAAAIAGAKPVVIARGGATAKAAGAVKIKLVPTKAAKRAAKRLRKATVTIAVSQGPAGAKAMLKLR
jgi:hypothetical protein